MSGSYLAPRAARGSRGTATKPRAHDPRRRPNLQDLQDLQARAHHQPNAARSPLFPVKLGAHPPRGRPPWAEPPGPQFKDLPTAPRGAFGQEWTIPRGTDAQPGSSCRLDRQPRRHVDAIGLRPAAPLRSHWSQGARGQGTREPGSQGAREPRGASLGRSRHCKNVSAVVPARSCLLLNFTCMPLSNAPGASIFRQMTQRQIENPAFTPGERIADNVIHVSGLAIGLTAVVTMMVVAFLSLPAWSTASLAIYGVGLLAMLGCSAAYHMSPVTTWKGLLQRLDHAAIFLKIAGTYTPFGAIKIGGTTGLALLGTVWSVALLGSGAKILLASTWDRLAIPLYLALGWCGIVMFQDLAASVTPATLILLGLGGVLYTVGVIFHLWRSLPYQNAVWHAFVLAGTGCHFGAVTSAVFV